MSFFLSPFKFIFELIGFLISAAFVYGLALVAAVALIAHAIASNPKEIVYETCLLYTSPSPRDRG